jgi:hypothetical protein
MTGSLNDFIILSSEDMQSGISDLTYLSVILKNGLNGDIQELSSGLMMVKNTFILLSSVMDIGRRLTTTHTYQ